ncbi:sensor histidine kinase [Rhizosaccharibacter radicis]|uniref:histidine kinase n=1 Tax=Rhizosaccharibacter radicis TaxID=2782605 RepID=A0ABT1VUX1_9PROT|nr:GAF domain-containing protein [Acetobacteraceae bacterium KSS12]
MFTTRAGDLLRNDSPAGTGRNIATSAPEIQAQLDRQLRQGELVADFALLLLRSDSIEPLFQEACHAAAVGLGATQAKLLQFRPGTADFVLRAAVGWPDAAIGTTTLGSGLRSPAGEAFRSGRPVVCGDGSQMFRLPRLLRQQNILSAVVVPIQQDEPFGVLEVDSPDEEAFSRHDVSFLRSLGTILAAAVERRRREKALSRAREFAASLLEACPDVMEALDARGLVLASNHTAGDSFGANRPGLDWCRDWIPDESAEDGPAHAALHVASTGGTGRFNCFRPDRHGNPRWWDVVVAAVPTDRHAEAPRAGSGRNAPAPVPLPDQEPGIAADPRFVAVARDITEQVQASQDKDRMLREKDLLMLEVHHRVKNSLQLVQNLLSLQSRAATERASADQLLESANRVHTIAAIHDRLYRSGAALSVEIGPYLQGLIDDLEGGLASTLQQRPIRLAADPAIWAAADVPTLGLVLTELVTNSLKYGRGTVRVIFRQPPGGQATLAVEDDGGGPPPGFDLEESQGLGMRLVTGLLNGDGAGLEIERPGGRARFLARFPLPTDAFAVPLQAF